MAITKKHTLIYLVAYLAGGGLGLVLFPQLTLDLLQSSGDYGSVMPRLVGMFMCAIAFFVYRILSLKDWKYYPTTIFIRSTIVVFMTWLYYYSRDPLFLVLIAIVLAGLLPSIFLQLKGNKEKSDIR